MEVSVRELRNRTKQVIDQLELGEEIVLTRHGRPIGRITPMSPADDTASSRLLRMADELPSLDTGLLDELLEERRSDRDAADAEGRRKSALFGH